jgi:hypothetical protein
VPGSWGCEALSLYELIAEEVARVYAGLELAPMLLNEAQHEQQKVAAQDRHSAEQDAQISQL